MFRGGGQLPLGPGRSFSWIMVFNCNFSQSHHQHFITDIEVNWNGAVKVDNYLIGNLF